MRRTLLALNIGALAALSATSGTAQEASGFALEEVVVTAQKRAEDAQDIPISVQAFSASAIDKLGANNLSDLSEAAPSLDIGGLGRGSQQWMGMRGVTDFARNVGIDARMGVDIDGVFQGRSYAADVPLLGLESVELLRGPQGTLFGKNTETGAISLNTKKPSEDFEAEGPFTDMGKGTILRLPIAHADGRYHTTEDGLAELERNDQVAFRYTTPSGDPPNGSDANPNGSVSDIAGVYNREKNVLGMMPHPERASEGILGNEQGLTLFTSLRRHLGFE